MGRTMRVALVVVGVALGAGTSGCGAPEADVPWQERLAGLNHDVGPGATGEDVAAVHAYLSRFGYFPNSELAQEFPRWRPVLSRAPSNPRLFDEQLAGGVRELQRRAGVAETGIVDEATRAVLRTARCGVPDGNPPDPSEKFAHTPSSWGFPAPALKWKVINANDVDIALVRDAARAALATWAAASTLTFEEATGSAATDLSVEFRSFGPNQTLVMAQTTFPRSGDMLLNSDKTFSVGSSTATNDVDLQTLMLHEFGHALGLDHSTVDVISVPNSPVMYAAVTTGFQKRSLKVEDQKGISTLYDTWEAIPGGAQGRDIALNWNTAPGAPFFVWRVGNDAAPGGYNVYRLNGSTWELATGGRGATGIAVDAGGRPWIVDASGNTYRRSTSLATSGTWQQIPGCARDIAISPLTAFTWKIDCQAAANGYGGIIKKWNPDTQNWISTGGGGARISVNQLGIPYVVDIFGTIYRRDSSDPAVNSWTIYPNGCGVDIAASNTWLWVLGCDTGPFGNGVWLWNAQNSGWYYFGGASRIALDQTSRPWVTSSDYSMWRIFK